MPEQLPLTNNFLKRKRFLSSKRSFSIQNVQAKYCACLNPSLLDTVMGGVAIITGRTELCLSIFILTKKGKGIDGHLCPTRALRLLSRVKLSILDIMCDHHDHRVWQRDNTTYLALVGFIALVGVFFAPLLLGIRTFPDGDFNFHFLPFSLFQQQAILEIHSPVWNPYTYNGHPFLADVQAAAYYPLSNLLLLLTLPFRSEATRLYFLQVEAAIHTILAGFFVYLLVRELTGRPLAAFLAGCAFAFSGYLTGYPPLQLAILRTAIWLPLIMWLLWRAFRQPRQWVWWIGAATAYAVALLAGHSQTFLFISYVIVAWGALLFVLAIRSARAQIKWYAYLSRMAIFFLLFLALSAAQLWPSLEFAAYSVRANVNYDFVSGGFPLQDTWQLLFPGVLTSFSPLFVSIIALGLALVGVCSVFWPSAGDEDGERPSRAIILFFAGMAVFALLVSYGDNGFLYPLVYRTLPGWSFFRGQERAAYLLALALAVLAGFGAARVERASFAKLGRVLFPFAAAVIVGVLFFSLGWQLQGRSAIGHRQWLWIAAKAVFFAAALLAVLALLGSKLAKSRQMILIILLLVADLFFANFTTNLTAATLSQRSALLPEILALQEAVLDEGEAEATIPGRAYNEYRVDPNYGMRVQVEDVWGSSPLRLKRYERLFEEFPLDRLWRLTGVQHVLTWRRELFVPSELLAEFPQETDTTYLHRLTAKNPRAWVVNQIEWADDERAAELLADHSFDLDSTAVLFPGALEASDTLAPAGKNQVLLQRITPNRLQIQVVSEHGGLLVISENWMPGWQASKQHFDGAEITSVPLEIVRTNLTLLGMPIPPGEHTILLNYRPASVRYGLCISMATILLLGGLALWRKRKRRSES